MKKTIVTVTATIAALYVIGKFELQQRENKDLKVRVERLSRWNDLYYNTLTKTVKKLDGEERRETVRKFNEEVDFIRIMNHF